jgi:hypothetical protein
MKFLGSSWRNFVKNLFYTGRYDLPEILIQQLAEFPTAVTRKPLTVWSHLMDHCKDVGVVFQNGIQNFWSFGQSETGNRGSVMSLFYPDAGFSSYIDRQNSVTSKPASGQSRMCNGLKDGRVAQDFGVQLWNKILRKQFRFRFLLTVVHFYTNFRICFLSD